MKAPRITVVLVVAAALAAATAPGIVHAPARAEEAMVRESGYVRVRDGTLLNYTVVRPAGPGAFPTLLEYSGYRPGTNPDEDYIERFVPKGYAFVGVNVRGTGCSGGVWDFFQPVEATDGYDVIEWIAARPWSDGKVAMIGKSFPGITQLFVAETRPPHLVAIAPGHPFADAYRDVAYPGGIFNYSFASLWSFIAQPYESYQGAGQGIASGDPMCAAHQAQRARNVLYSPFVRALQHRWDDALIRERSPIYDIEKIDVPVWTVMAWQDEQVGPRAVDLLSRLDVPYHAILTNGHHSMYRTELGLAELERFYDHYVKGIDNGFESTPPLRVWWEATEETDEPTWITSHGAWPAPGARVKRLYLSESERLQRRPGSGAPDRYAYAGPTGQGIQNPEASGQEGSPDISMWHYYSPPPGTALAYTSKPLAKDTLVLGSASLNLWLASTAVDTDIQATITEVRPDGQEVYVQAGWLRASHRELEPSLTTPTRPYQTHRRADAGSLEPGSPAKMRLEVFPFGHAFRAGSRIRVWIDGPKFLPELWGFAALPLPATNSVHHDLDHRSSLALPVLPRVDAPGSLPACNTLIRQPCRADPLL